MHHDLHLFRQDDTLTRSQKKRRKELELARDAEEVAKRTEETLKQEAPKPVRRASRRDTPGASAGYNTWNASSECFASPARAHSKFLGVRLQLANWEPIP